MNSFEYQGGVLCNGAKCVLQTLTVFGNDLGFFYWSFFGGIANVFFFVYSKFR